MAVLQVLIILLTVHNLRANEDGYLRYVKDGCFKKGEALSCVKYKALKIAKKTLFGENMQNETIKANHMISFVPLDDSVIEKFKSERNESFIVEPRGFLSEWSELAKYFMKLVKDFFRVKGMRVDLPDGARTVEEEEVNEGRGKRKKLAIVVPLLTLLAAIKTKLLLIPVLLSVLLIKKLLLIAALLLPSLLNTLKACKHHPMSHYSYFGSSDNSDFSSDYGNSYSYGSSAGYGPSNRAYTMPKHRPTPAPVYITAPGSAA
ncbi:uncharacterized protein LOC128680614 [Plodia interpunctella]|uniref:uncharacterized protein LOC128680614 n=1 Tax=Plodia interpunctella TaxID=58824 RepID=UPI002368A13E|nr:uncharacterized protein LOC128680614 [Plodia interpunctella]XP_053619854.1 uncharacterized protein LOC128680614 [Plodia interpunctella]